MNTVEPPSAEVRARAAERLAGLATPAGALGRLGDLAVWVAATQGAVPPEPVDRVRAVIFAGDHGVADHGVSAYPKAVTPAMVRTFLAGRAGVSVLAAQHGVTVRVLDIGVDDDLEGVDPAVQAFKIRRGSGAIHVEDAMTPAETQPPSTRVRPWPRRRSPPARSCWSAATWASATPRRPRRSSRPRSGCRRSRSPGAAPASTKPALAHKIDVVQAALDRAGDRVDDPVDTLTALGSADIAAAAGFMAAAARAGVPVLLDGLISVASALMAERLAPGAAAWFAAGHRSTEPAQTLALDKLGLVPRARPRHAARRGQRCGRGRPARPLRGPAAPRRRPARRPRPRLTP